MKRSKNTWVTALLAGVIVSLSSCDLTEPVQAQTDKYRIFGSPSGMEAYALSFYRALPTLANGYRQDASCDIAAVSNTDTFIRDGAYNAETSTSWGWETLRNINYFIDGCNDPEYCTVENNVKNHYLGLARWFRAWFYYDKLVTYGEVPWFPNEIQAYERDVMYKDRDSRDVIIRNIIDDLDFAFNHITTTSSTGNSLVSRWSAAALKSRVCLFEGTYRKYHGLTGLEISADDLLREAAAAARAVMNDGGFSLNTSTGTKGAYRDLFYLQNPITSEVILAVCASAEAGIMGSQNWWYNTRSYGLCWSLTRAFIHTYLKLDGTSFTDQASYGLKSFAEELNGRDKRLEQTIRGLSFMYDGEIAVGDFKSVSLTGYQVVKYTLDESKYSGGNNINSIPLIRYAEVLLNYAEARAELDELTNTDWNSTIGAIRRRAGITGGTETLPTVADTYLQTVFYPDVNDPVLLEIRRERAIELVAEGMRFNDLRRWKRGELMETLPWTGIHIEAMDTPIDINGDGKDDYCFTTGKPVNAIDIQVNQNDLGIYFEANPESGYDLVYKPGAGNRKWYSDDRQYLYPVPAEVIRDYKANGYALSQNPNW